MPNPTKTTYNFKINPNAAAHVAVRPSVLHGHCKVLIIIIIVQ